MKLLLIEDDITLAEHLLPNLKDHGFLVNHVANATELKESLQFPEKIDAIILDRLLGSTDTKNLLPQIRKAWPLIPILVLSAISTPSERTDLINLGADDYMGKPFMTLELVARVRALLRRTSVPVGGYLHIGNVMIDSVKRIVSVGETAESLPAKEFLLLKVLCEEPGRVWSKNQLLDYVWGHSTDVDTNVVEATTTNVRKKLLGMGAKVSIKNMRNVGYWIEA